MTQPVSNVFSQFQTQNSNTQNTIPYTPNPLKTNSASDTFVNSNNTNKKDKNKKWKILTGIGVGIAAAVGTASLIYRCKFKAIKQLAEHIDFKPAKTIAEAKKFALENFKIRKFYVGDDVALANWVNESLTMVSNKYKGRAFLPTQVALLEKGSTAAASMSRALHAKRMSNVLRVNGEFFSKESEQILNSFQRTLDSMVTKRGVYVMPFQKCNPAELGKIAKELKEGKTLKISRFKLYSIVENASAYREYKKILTDNPIVIAKDVYAQNGFVDLAKKHSPSIFKELSELEKMPKEKISDYIVDLHSDLMKHLRFNQIPKSTLCPATHSNFTTIFHELGHANHERKAMFKYARMHVSYDKKNPTIGKLAEHFKNSAEEQLIASTVTNYAKHSPLEFVAEVYARMMEGHTFGDDVMNLYKKYKGPEIPNFA